MLVMATNSCDQIVTIMDQDWDNLMKNRFARLFVAISATVFDINRVPTFNGSIV